MHAIARTAELLREDPGEVRLVSSNGGFITKHAYRRLLGVSATATVPRRGNPGARRRSREAAPTFNDPVEIESYTVMYGPEGPVSGLAACLLDDGRRAWGNTREPDVLQSMVTEEFCGRPARLGEAGNVEFP